MAMVVAEIAVAEMAVAENAVSEMARHPATCTFVRSHYHRHIAVAADLFYCRSGGFIVCMRNYDLSISPPSRREFFL